MATPPGWAADEAAIAAALQLSADSWNSGNLPRHLSIYDDSVTYMTGNGPRHGVAPIQRAFAETYWRDGRPVQSLRFDQVDIRPLGEGVALQTGRFVLFGGGQSEQSGWFTLIWVRTARGWKAVHDHSS
jgi:ketosteroid isomerase-like protein